MAKASGCSATLKVCVNADDGSGEECDRTTVTVN